MALSFAHIFMTVAGVLAAGFGIATAIRAYRSQIRRRWLWILISLLGAPVTTMNWATGQVRTQALRVQVVNVGVVRPGPNAPWFLSVALDRKSTRLNSSHSQISYAVFCLKKKNTAR